MPFLITLTLFLFAALAGPGPSLAEDTLPAILQGIRKTYGPLPGLSVPYEREIISKSRALLGDQAKGDLAKGHIHFKSPHALRVQQESPSQEDVITDGDILWWFLPKKAEAYRYPSHKMGKELRVLNDIFQGLKEAQESFEIKLTGQDAQGRYRLLLVPRPPWPEVDRIHLTVTQGEYQIRIVEVLDPLGGMTRFTLGKLAPRKSFDPGFFSFIPPAGVKVIEENPGP